MAKLTYSMTSANLHFHEKRNGKWIYNYIVPNRYQYLCCLFIHFYCRSINLVIVAQPISHLIYYYDIKQSGTKGREGGLVGERNDMPYTKWWLLRSIVAFTALTANWFARKKKYKFHWWVQMPLTRNEFLCTSFEYLLHGGMNADDCIAKRKTGTMRHPQIDYQFVRATMRFIWSFVVPSWNILHRSESVPSNIRNTWKLLSWNPKNRANVNRLFTLLIHIWEWQMKAYYNLANRFRWCWIKVIQQQQLKSPWNKTAE